MPQASEVAVAKLVFIEALVERVQSSQCLLAAYSQAMDGLRDSGAMPAVATLENEVKQELRRQRKRSNDEPAVAGASADLNVARAAAERQL